MDIWVRSQDGSILTKVDGIYIQERGMDESCMFDLIGIQRGGAKIRLGKYRYKSDANNVLEEFKNWVKRLENIFLERLSTPLRGLSNDYRIFRLPEDKNV